MESLYTILNMPDVPIRDLSANKSANLAYSLLDHAMDALTDALTRCRDREYLDTESPEIASAWRSIMDMDKTVRLAFWQAQGAFKTLRDEVEESEWEDRQ